MTTGLVAFLDAQMQDAETQWSVGSFGAIAEFARDAGEPVVLSQDMTSLAAVTGRGGIRIALRADMRPFAFETTTKDGWNHRVALCLPEDRCAMSGRTVLTEIGADHDALRAQDRDAVLFDLGLGARQVDCCIRVADPEIAAQLRAHCGHPVFGTSAMAIVLATNPHRVFLSRLGRVEVFQPIPPPDGKSPDGPHTHVLPGLLRHRRTHAATEPIPDGLIPCAHVYPPHPAKDVMGRDRPFDRARHDAFQVILQSCGDPEILALKQQVLDAVATGADPSAIAVTDRRFARTTIRVTLRQLRAQHESVTSLDTSLSTWLAAHERPGGSIDDPHHHEAHP
ncbi:MAG: hypothetical protein K2Y71_06500 [Xanthobacteraceae bacterium]|nr:hypothetical protein [Xanthobacteraceae bacterium]